MNESSALAGIGQRFGARFIDGLLLLAVSLPLALGFGDIRLEEDIFDVPAWVQWTTLLVALAYEVGLIVATGQTLGKRLLGIRVVDAWTGGLPNVDQAVRRSLPTMLQQVPYVGLLAWLAYAPALWHPRRQGLHDRLAGTVVVEARPPEPPMPWPGGDRF